MITRIMFTVIGKMKKMLLSKMEREVMFRWRHRVGQNLHDWEEAAVQFS